MKTLLAWNVNSEFSREVCRGLALGGRRLLLTGASAETLTELDGALCQSELHRYATVSDDGELLGWVQEQQLGLDGVVLFPHLQAAGVLEPSAASVAAWKAALLDPLATLQELQPLLLRGKKPKLVSIVLDVGLPSAAGFAAVACAAWREAAARLHEESASRGIVTQLFEICSAKAPTGASPPPENTPEPHDTAPLSESAALVVDFCLRVNPLLSGHTVPLRTVPVGS